MSITKLYTVEEVAEILNISHTVIYDLLRRGVMPGRKIARQWRIIPAELDVWIINSAGADICPAQRIALPQRPARRGKAAAEPQPQYIGTHEIKIYPGSRIRPIGEMLNGKM